MSTAQADRVDALLKRLQVVLYLTITIVGLVGAGVLWGARLQDEQKRQREKSELHDRDIGEIKRDQREFEKAFIELKTILQQQQQRHSTSQNQNVKIGLEQRDARQAVIEAARLQGYLTTAQYAQLMGDKSESWARQQCQDNHVPGAYRLNGGKLWAIPLSVLDTLPQTAANCAPVPQSDALANRTEPPTDDHE